MATKIAYWTEEKHKSETEDKQYLVHSSSNGYEGVRRTINLLVRDNGQIVDETGEITQERGLNLGNQGDHLVTLIHFDTHELQWGLADSNHDDEEGDRFLEHEYKPVIHFYNPDKEHGKLNPISFKFEGGDFFVPQELTKDFGKYQIIYSLREQFDSGDTEGNVGEDKDENYREVFISNIFFGEVRETLFSNDNFNSWISAEKLDNIQQTSYLKKPSVEIDINDETKEIVLSNEGLEWGNLQDNLMTDVRINLSEWNLGGEWDGDSSFYMVFIPDEEGFNNGLQTQAVRLEYQNNAFYTYIPSIITQNTNKWGTQLFARPKDELSYYNFTLPVIDGSYSDEDVNIDWMSGDGLIHISQIGFNPDYINGNGKKYWYGYDDNGIRYSLGELGETIKLKSYDFDIDALGKPEAVIISQYFFAEPFEIQVKSNFLQQEDIDGDPDEEQNIVHIPENALYDTYRFALTGRSSDENNPDASEFIVTSDDVSYQLTQTGQQVQEILDWVDENKEWVKQENVATKQDVKNLDNKYIDALSYVYSGGRHEWKVGDNLSGQTLAYDGYLAEIIPNLNFGEPIIKTQNGTKLYVSGASGNLELYFVFPDGNTETIEPSESSEFSWMFPWVGGDDYTITDICSAAEGKFYSDPIYYRTNVKARVSELDNSVSELADSIAENAERILALDEQLVEVKENYATDNELKQVKEDIEDTLKTQYPNNKQLQDAIDEALAGYKSGPIDVVDLSKYEGGIISQEDYDALAEASFAWIRTWNVGDDGVPYYSDPHLFTLVGGNAEDGYGFRYESIDYEDRIIYSCGISIGPNREISMDGQISSDYVSRSDIPDYAVDLESDQEIYGRKIFRGPVGFDGQLWDKTASQGEAGQILSSTGNGVEWIDAPSGGNVDLSNYYTKNETYNTDELDQAIGHAINQGAAQGEEAAVTYIEGVLNSYYYTKDQVDEKLKNSNSETTYERVTEDILLVHTEHDPGTSFTQFLYLDISNAEEDSVDIIGTFEGFADVCYINKQVWIEEPAGVLANGMTFEVKNNILEFCFDSAPIGATITPSQSSLVYFVKQVEVSNNSGVTVTDLRYVS